jgi:hypothetical protein
LRERTRYFKQKRGGTKVHYLYDGDTLIAELDATGNVINNYVWGASGLTQRVTASLAVRGKSDLARRLAQESLVLLEKSNGPAAAAKPREILARIESGAQRVK